MNTFVKYFMKTRIFLLFIFLLTFILVYYNPPKSWQFVSPSPSTVTEVSEPSLQVENQSSTAFFIIKRVDLPWPGFVLVTSPLETNPEVIGVSDISVAGSYSDLVVVPTARAVRTGESLRASLVKDNGNGVYDSGDQIMPVSGDFVISGLELQATK